jgi:hypothetical protein
MASHVLGNLDGLELRQDRGCSGLDDRVGLLCCMLSIVLHATYEER